MRVGLKSNVCESTLCSCGLDFSFFILAENVPGAYDVPPFLRSYHVDFLFHVLSEFWPH